MVLVPDGIENIVVGGHRATVTNNVARLTVWSGDHSMALNRGPGAAELRRDINPTIPQPPLSEADPSVAVNLSPGGVGGEDVRQEAGRLAAEPACRIDPWTLVATHREGDASAHVVSNGAGARGVIVHTGVDGRIVSARVSPADRPTSPNRLAAERGVDSNLVAGVAPDGYTLVRAGSQVRGIRENVFLIVHQSAPETVRTVTLAGPAGELTLRIPPPGPVAPLPGPFRAVDPLTEVLQLLQPGGLGEGRDTGRLSDLSGRPAYLLFVAPDCSACDKAVANLRNDAISESGSENVRPVVVIVGRDANGAVSVGDTVTDGDTPVFRDRDGWVTSRLGISEIPGALVLDGKGAPGAMKVFADTLSLTEALAAAAARREFTFGMGPDCPTDPGTMTRIGSTPSGVFGYSARTPDNNRAFVVAQGSTPVVRALTTFPCDVVSSQEPRLEQRQQISGLLLAGDAPTGYTRITADGAEATIVDGLVLLDTDHVVASAILSGPAGELSVPVTHPDP